MNITVIRSQLSQFEAQLAFFSDAIVTYEPDTLQSTANGLQTLAVAMSASVPKMALVLKGNHAEQLRVKAIAARLGVMREALLRQGVAVDRALAALIPATQTPTYFPKTGLSARSPYGSAGRQSGEFKAVAA